MPKSVLFDQEDVIQKVTDLFWRKGYNGTSMQDLVDVTGLNRSSIYNTFGDKFQLFEQSLKHYQQSQNEMLDTSFAEAKSPKQAIVSLFQGIRDEVVASRENRGCFLSNCTSELSNEEPRVREILVDNMEKVVSSFKLLIIKAQEAGEIDASKNPDTLALFLFSSLQGLRITSMIEPYVDGITEEILKTL